MPEQMPFIQTRFRISGKNESGRDRAYFDNRFRRSHGPFFGFDSIPANRGETRLTAPRPPKVRALFKNSRRSIFLYLCLNS